MDKICRICHQQKPPTAFYKNRRAKDGLTTRCKTCIKEANRQYRTSPRGRAMRKLRRYKDKQKIQARDTVSNAIKRGALPKAQTCQCHYCDRLATVYHHHKGYRTKSFLDVLPVCDTCHPTVESKAKKANLGTEGLPLFEMANKKTEV